MRKIQVNAPVSPEGFPSVTGIFYQPIIPPGEIGISGIDHEQAEL
jgi:hypothetical protein